MDPYEQKLKSLFRSHSSGEQITQSELQALCVTLQLQKAPFLVHLLLENKQSCSFIEFRRGLLQVINEGIYNFHSNFPTLIAKYLITWWLEQVVCGEGLLSFRAKLFLICCKFYTFHCILCVLRYFIFVIFFGCNFLLIQWVLNKWSVGKINDIPTIFKYIWYAMVTLG